MDFTFITDFFNFLFEKFNALFKFFGTLAQSALKALFDVLQDGMCVVIDIMASALKTGLDGLPENPFNGWSDYWNLLPHDLVQVAIALGVVPASAIIIAAILIRVTLQLIPFVRLGS